MARTGLNRWQEERLKEWVVGRLGRGTMIQELRPLFGGISTTLLRVVLREGDDVVVRVYDNAEWLREEPDLPQHEAASIQAAAAAEVPTPELIAVEPDPGAIGLPVLLMTALPGAVALQLPDQRAWLAGLAEALATIHLTPVNGFSWRYFSYTEFNSLEIPEWSSDRPLWEEAFRVVRQEPPAGPEVFLHRDFHPANVLWEAGKLSGVVDWVNACTGAAGVDIGHCRLNLAMLHGVEAADQFLDHYQSCRGNAFKYAPYWDVSAILQSWPGPPGVYSGWTALGMSGLTDELMLRRYEGLLRSVLERRQT